MIVALALMAQITWFDIADITCWRRLLADLRCGQRQPVELIGTAFLGPGVREELARQSLTDPQPRLVR